MRYHIEMLLFKLKQNFPTIITVATLILSTFGLYVALRLVEQAKPKLGPCLTFYSAARDMKKGEVVSTADLAPFTVCYPSPISEGTVHGTSFAPFPTSPDGRMIAMRDIHGGELVTGSDFVPPFDYSLIPSATFLNMSEEVKEVVRPSDLIRVIFPMTQETAKKFESLNFRNLQQIEVTGACLKMTEKGCEFTINSCLALDLVSAGKYDYIQIPAQLCEPLVNTFHWVPYEHIVLATSVVTETAPITITQPSGITPTVTITPTETITP